MSRWGKGVVTLAGTITGSRHKSREVVVNGVRLAYVEREAVGQNASPLPPPILLLHALLASSETLTELIAKLPQDRRVVALDLLSAEPEDRTNKLDVRRDRMQLGCVEAGWGHDNVWFILGNTAGKVEPVVGAQE